MNIVYDSEGYEYPVDDQGMSCFLENEHDGANNEQQNQQENC